MTPRRPSPRPRPTKIPPPPGLPGTLLETSPNLADRPELLDHIASELATAGWVVVPGFLSPERVATLARESLEL